MTPTFTQHDQLTLNHCCAIINDWAEVKGWNEAPLHDFLVANNAPPELLVMHDTLVKLQECALITSEVSERLEFARAKGKPMDDHVPELTGEEAEFADMMIRIFHYCGRRGIDLGRAVKLKHEFNISRPYRHDKKV